MCIFVPKYDSGRKGWKGRLSSTLFPQKTTRMVKQPLFYVQNLGLHESSLNGNYHETGGFVSILGPGIGTDLLGDVPSPLFYEIVKEKDGRHFANKKVFGITDLGPNTLGFQSSILVSIVFEPEPNRSIFLWRRLLSCIFQSMKLFHLWNTCLRFGP